MRYAIAAILLLFSVAAFGQLDQFRMVGSGSWSVVDDSTYSATVTFASDLTANSFLPTGVVDSMRVFTQRGQLYTIDSVGAKTFSTAVIYAVEYSGDWGSPSGQVLVYETRGRETVPAIPFATNGATSKLQEAVVTHNAAINNGVSTTQLADSTTAAKTYTNNQIASVAPVKDTIVQASHGFSVGDPIWYSGDYLLSLDTGLTVRVDGVVSAVPDVNTFVLQRTGRFTLTAHGFSVGVQLYVQPDGSYSTTDTSNTLVYGYALDANTIEIGVKPDYVRSLARPDSSVFSTRSYVNNNIEKKYTSYNLDTTITSSQLSGQEFTLNVSYTAPLLDRINIGDGYAYSLRKLSSDYNGPIITVVENDGDTLNVYTINSELDTASMKAFSSDSLYVKRWYNQSGKAAHLSNADTINWPIIMAGGNLIRQNGKLAVYVEDKNNEYLFNQSTTTSGSALSYVLVYTRGSSGNSVPFGSYAFDSATGWGVLTNFSGNHVSASNSYSALSGREPIVRTTIADHPSSVTPYLYFSVLSSDTAAAWANNTYLTPNYSAKGAVGTLRDGISIGNRGLGGTLGWSGYIQEVIITTTDQTVNKNLIYNDANGYYDFGGGVTETADLAGATVTLPYPDISILNKEFTLNHTNSSGLYTTVKTDSSLTFDVGGTLRDSIQVNSANNTSVTLRVNKVGDLYAWKVIETTDTDFLPQLDTIGVIYAERIQDALSLDLPVGKRIFTSSGASYTIKSSYTEEVGLDTIFQHSLSNGKYAIIDLKAGWLDLDEVEKPSYMTEIEKANYATTKYCYYNPDCSTVYIETDKSYTDTWQIPEHISIASNHSGRGRGTSGNNNLNGAKIGFNLNDKANGIGIELINISNSSAYRTGSLIKNMRIEAETPAKVLIDFGGGYSTTIKDVSIYADSCFAGIAHFTDASDGGIKNVFERVYIESPDSSADYGIYLQGASDVYFQDLSVLQAGVGLWSNSGVQIHGDYVWFENLDSCAIISSAALVSISRLYTESNGGNGNSNGMLWFKNGNNITIENSVINNGGAYTTFKFDTVSVASIKNSRLQGATSVFPELIQIDTTLDIRVSMDNVSGIDQNIWRRIWTNNIVTKRHLRLDNFGPAWPKTIDHKEKLLSNIPNAELTEPLISSATIKEGDIDGTIEIRGDTVNLRGSQNLILYSEALSNYLPVNGTIHEDGISSEPGIDSLVSSGNASLIFSTTSLNANTPYVFSAWMKDAGLSSGSKVILELSQVGSGDSVSDTITLNGTLTEYKYTLISPPSATNPLVRVINADTIAIGKVQLSEGYNADEYISTSGSSILSTGVVFDGDLTITGILSAEKYRTFTPIIFDNVDTLLVDRLELGFESLKITDELDGLEVKQVTYTTDRNVTADTQVRLEYFDISASSYTSFGAGTIANGTNQITVTGLTKVVEATDIIYLEVVTTGGEANGISATLKLK